MLVQTFVAIASLTNPHGCPCNHQDNETSSEVQVILDNFHQDPAGSVASLQALHPKYQTAREILAILNDSTLFDKLGNESIREIRKTETGYVIFTGTFEIQVDVNYLPPSIPGIIGEPARFELVFHDPVISSQY